MDFSNLPFLDGKAIGQPSILCSINNLVEVAILYKIKRKINILSQLCCNSVNQANKILKKD